MHTAQASLITRLNHIAQITDSPLAKAVALEVLNNVDSDKELTAFFADLGEHGCRSGMVRSLIYYTDTHNFFDEHYEEIEELRLAYEESTDMDIRIDGDLKNGLAWFAFEETAYQLYLKLESPQ